MTDRLNPYDLGDWLPESWHREAQRHAALRETALDRRVRRLLDGLDAPTASHAAPALAWLSALRDEELIMAGVFADLIGYVAGEHR